MKKEYRRRSLRYKVFFLLVAMAVIFDITVTAVSYVVYTKNMNSENETTCFGLAETIASDINPNHLGVWLGGERTGEYLSCEENLINLTQSFATLKKVMVCKMNASDMQPVFYVDDETMQNTASESIPYSESYMSVKDALVRGKFSGALHIPGGIAAFVPVKETQGKVLAYVVCEITTEEMLAARSDFIKNLFATVGIVSVILMIAANMYVGYILITPINRIESGIRKFTKDNSLGDKTIESINKISQRRKISEISNLCDCFTDLINDVSIKHNEVREFDKNIMKKMQDVLGEDKIDY